MRGNRVEHISEEIKTQAVSHLQRHNGNRARQSSETQTGKKWKQRETMKRVKSWLLPHSYDMRQMSWWLFSPPSFYLLSCPDLSLRFKPAHDNIYLM